MSSLKDFATRYTQAWCSQNPQSVASFFSSDGSLTINNGQPSVGRDAITVAAQSFMTAFPDLVVRMDEICPGEPALYRWTLSGHYHKSPNPCVEISGYEEWWLDGHDGLITKSLGHYDAEDYKRQIEGVSQ